MTNFTSGIIFIVAVLTCLTADSAPLWLTVSWVAVAAVIALAGRAEGRKRPCKEGTTPSTAYRKVV